jgi:endonuclease YncB( thermonuclease family)
LARRPKSNRAWSRRRRAVLFGLSLIGTAVAVWLDRTVTAPRRPAPAASRPETYAADAARFQGGQFLVVKVVDGDTLHLAAADLGHDTTKVRLIGVDAPEMGTGQGDRMYFAEEATAFVRRLAQGGKVRVYLDERAGSRDRYGRLLAYLELPDGRFLNEELLLEGYAYADRRFRHGYYQKYLQLEAAARSAGRGLWPAVTPEQMPPWLRKRLDQPSSAILQVVFPDLAVEGPLADTEDFGGLLAVTLRADQGIGDGLFLQFVQ